MSRSQEIVIDIKATPEEVFDAVTNPTQIVKWFGAEARVDPRVGGEYVLIWAPGMETSSAISAWEPGQHFGKYSDRSFTYSSTGRVETGQTQRIVIDYYIEPLAGGLTRLRLVQSGFGEGSAWDGEYESTKSGWAEYLGKIKALLEK